ncbi:hypothetical protein [Desulfocapsa sulfexigens]|uniref:hypothetical protein n=1 Tax=Desulfocapsa sulfexigens TaxID=65555 RepID=UPI00129480EE|nr:hypothetical protein [Desulfocapsa sulfexigens]
MQYWDEVERRNGGGERRALSERRASHERRFDYRDAEPPPRRSIKSWMRVLSNARPGVDRCRGQEPRTIEKRRSQGVRSILTPEELAALLQE